MGISLTMSGGDEKLYYDNKLNTYRNEMELMGKRFLIEDTITTPEWTLQNETKVIGKYTCFKATRMETVIDKKLDEKTFEFTETPREKTIVAWFTLEVPLSHGPSFYRGLPGLVLQVKDDKLTILCTKIVLNPEKELTVEIPDKGKVVSQAEFDEIQEKKNAEMMEQFKGLKDRKRKSSSNTIIIGG